MNDKFIQLIVVTTGEDIDERFNVNQPLQVVKARALQGLPPGSNPNDFVLEFEDQPLDDNKKIKDYIEQFGWHDGTILELVPRPVVI
jgi:hypothetical protein